MVLGGLLVAMPTPASAQLASQPFTAYGQGDAIAVNALTLGTTNPRRRRWLWIRQRKADHSRYSSKIHPLLKLVSGFFLYGLLLTQLPLAPPVDDWMAFVPPPQFPNVFSGGREPTSAPGPP